MTWLVFLLGTAAAACIAVGFYLLGLRSRQIDASSYWQGWADREATLDVPVLVDVSDVPWSDN